MAGREAHAPVAEVYGIMTNRAGLLVLGLWALFGMGCSDEAIGKRPGSEPAGSISEAHTHAIHVLLTDANGKQARLDIPPVDVTGTGSATKQADRPEGPPSPTPMAISPVPGHEIAATSENPGWRLAWLPASPGFGSRRPGICPATIWQ